MRAAAGTLLLLALLAVQGLAVPIVVGAGALERHAARELADHLSRLYPDREFSVARSGQISGDFGRFIQIQTGVRDLRPGAFRVAVEKRGPLTVGVIAAGDGRGALHGVYALLGELGFGFYLSSTADPEPRSEFTFDGWSLADEPLFAERLVFNWHNFLSSASTWDLPDWQSYIDQAARMRYSGIMVHAYGNNPMFAFEHNGVTKPVGYLSTTRSGRDWGTQHVNDVRRLYGAAGIFEEPVFGARAAMVPEDQRVAAATGLMQRVFRYAESRGLDVVFAVDVDTLPANPQEIIRTLPAEARFRSGDSWLPNPDTQAGEDYYRSLVGSLLETYPEIDQVVVWFRRQRTPWLNLEPGDLPAAWQAPFEAAIQAHPGLAGDEYTAPMFALGRVIQAFDRLIAEAGRDDVTLASGSWDFAYFPAADAMFPPGVKLLPLDWSIEFESDEVQQTIKAVAANRPVSPIVWAHHDDHTYVGRPYRPFDDFASTLEADKASGFGIIHWTTRPLDLYFKSLARQVWKASRDEDLDITCQRMAERTFGPEAADRGAAYLMKWIAEAPMFGRETSDRFIDRPLGDTEAVARKSRARREILESIPKRDLTDSGLDHWSYYRQFERFIEQFHIAHNDLERSRAALTEGRLEKARKDIGRPIQKPEMAIEQYAIAARQGTITRGEEALLVSLNLRWLPYFRGQKQAVGLLPARVNFQPTQHDPLAQGAGRNTFFFEEDGTIWKALGEKETGLPVFVGKPPRRAPDGIDPGLLASGVVVGEPATLELTGLGNAELLPGERRVELFYLDEGASPARVVKSEQTIMVRDGKVPVTVRPFNGLTKLCALIVY